MADNEWRGTYQSSLAEGETDLTPQLDTGGVEVRLMSGENLLEAREEGKRNKVGVCQEDTGVKGIPFGIGFFLTSVSLLQFYFVLTSWTSQELYLRRAAFVQCLISTRSSSPLNYKQV